MGIHWDTTVESDKAAVRVDSCLEGTGVDSCPEGTGVGNHEGVGTVEGGSMATEDRARQAIEVDTEGSLLVGLKDNQILRNLIVIKDITIGILEVPDITIQLQHLLNWVAEVKILRLLEEDGDDYAEPHFLGVHELVRHLRQGLVEGAEFQ